MGCKVSIIAIVARDGAIGRGGDQPFHISADFKHFKELTLGKPIIMGRKTFEALPKGALPGRLNIVVTRNAGFSAPGVKTVGSLAEAMEMCAAVDEVMIIGGGQIYAQAEPLAGRMYLTEVDGFVDDADTFFPKWTQNWRETSRSESYMDASLPEGVTYSFAVYDVVSDTE